MSGGTLPSLNQTGEGFLLTFGPGATSLVLVLSLSCSWVLVLFLGLGLGLGPVLSCLLGCLGLVLVLVLVFVLSCLVFKDVLFSKWLL